MRNAAMTNAQLVNTELVNTELVNTEWWKRAVAYQVYVRSFADSNGDGIGDLDGVTSRLSALEQLGVDVIWLSPVFASPMRDHGYDVSDYRSIDPMFGDLAALDRLIDSAHQRQIRVLLDWVPNHTSTDHEWFVESASSLDNPKRDWYVWADTADAAPPNNWMSCFPAVGSAWSRHHITRQWYLHSFLREQADLNWDNPAVVAAAHDVMRFWLDRGIDGFRIDVVHNLGKDPALTDNPGEIIRPSPATAGRRFDEDHWPNLWPKIEGLRAVLEEYPDTIAVGESYVLDPVRLAEYTRPGRLHLGHDFTLTELDWNATAFASAIDRANTAVGEDGWPAWIVSSHDHGRLATRWTADGLIAPPGRSAFDPDRAEAALAILILMRGTPFVFQGEELALPDASDNDGLDVDGRARSRAPIPWTTDNETAGFTTGTPWMQPVGGDRARAAQTKDADSTLNFVRSLIELRHQSDALASGAQRVSAANGILTIERSTPGSTVTVLINMSGNTVNLAAPTLTPTMIRRAAIVGSNLVLEANAVVVVQT